MVATKLKTEKSAVISECGLYRYRLTRTWDLTLRSCAFVMLNPSTADAHQDDPTIRRCVNFARGWGYGGIEVVNLFAYRSTDPSELKKVKDPVGPENDHYITQATVRCGAVVAAWGANGGLKSRDIEVRGLLRKSGVRVMCLALTQKGQPQHPLFVKADRQQSVFLEPA